MKKKLNIDKLKKVNGGEAEQEDYDWREHAGVTPQKHMDPGEGLWDPKEQK